MKKGGFQYAYRLPLVVSSSFFLIVWTVLWPLLHFCISPKSIHYTYFVNKMILQHGVFLFQHAQVCFLFFFYRKVAQIFSNSHWRYKLCWDVFPKPQVSQISVDQPANQRYLRKNHVWCWREHQRVGNFSSPKRTGPPTLNGLQRVYGSTTAHMWWRRWDPWSCHCFVWHPSLNVIIVFHNSGLVG